MGGGGSGPAGSFGSDGDGAGAGPGDDGDDKDDGEEDGSVRNVVAVPDRKGAVMRLGAHDARRRLDAGDRGLLHGVATTGDLLPWLLPPPLMLLLPLWFTIEGAEGLGGSARSGGGSRGSWGLGEDRDGRCGEAGTCCCCCWGDRGDDALGTEEVDGGRARRGGGEMRPLARRGGGMLLEGDEAMKLGFDCAVCKTPPVFVLGGSGSGSGSG